MAGSGPNTRTGVGQCRADVTGDSGILRPGAGEVANGDVLRRLSAPGFAGDDVSQFRRGGVRQNARGPGGFQLAAGLALADPITGVKVRGRDGLRVDLVLAFWSEPMAVM